MPVIAMLALLIPTYNRPSMLRRLVGYYRGRRLVHPLHVVDSSPPEAAALNLAVVDAAHADLDIHYHGFAPETAFDTKVNRVLGQLDVPLAGLCADDDFVTPEGLDAAGKFLMANPEYSAAHGYALSFTLPAAGGGAGGAIVTRPYRQRSLEQEDPLTRMVAHLTHYSTTFYSLHRREDLMRELSMVFRSDLDVRLGEILMSCSGVIRGKVKRLDVLYLAREVHAGSANMRIERMDSLRERGEFEAVYDRFRDSLANELSQAAGISRQRAERAVDFAFRGYETRAGRSVRRDSRSFSRFWYLLIYFLWDIKTPGARRDIDLRPQMQAFDISNLLHDRSPHALAFRPVMDAIGSGGSA